MTQTARQVSPARVGVWRFGAARWRSGVLGPILLLCAAVAPAGAETLRVGPGERFQLPSQAAAAARPGDTVLIAPAAYRDCASWRVPGLTIAAMGQGAVEISGPVCGDKALFVVAAPDITVSGITFRDAVAPAGNGAGIRAEGGNLRVLRSQFIGNQNGILTASDPRATLTIEDSRFIGNGALIGDCAHGLYVGHIARVVIRRSRL